MPRSAAADPRGRWWVLYLVVALVAFGARLLPVLSANGLFVVGQYDAAVYFGSAVGLMHGRLPYRDFLLLHPPGSALALTPFALLGLIVGDSYGWAIARVATMALGAVGAVLVARLLRPAGALPALLGALCYALFLPAVAVQVTTRLEGLADACLLGALVLLSPDRAAGGLRTRSLVLAGVLLGFATTVKIWGLVPLVVVATCLALIAGRRALGHFIVGAAGAGVIVCLPFALAAPAAMWRQVVSDQLGRPESSASTLDRLADVTGLGGLQTRLGDAALPVVVAAVAVLAVAALLAAREPSARLAVVLLGAFVAMQLSTPSWFPHYAGVSAGVLAVTLGAAVSALLASLTHRAGRAVVLGVAGFAVAAALVQLTGAQFGERFPARRMAATVAPLPGCVTADDPGALIGMNVLGRNLRRGCPLVLDLGGYSYDYRPQIPRQRDPRWQRFFLVHLSSGTATLKTRYHTGFGLSRATARTVNRWPVIVEVDGFRLRRPSP